MVKPLPYGFAQGWLMMFCVNYTEIEKDYLLQLMAVDGSSVFLQSVVCTSGIEQVRYRIHFPPLFYS